MVNSLKFYKTQIVLLAMCLSFAMPQLSNAQQWIESDKLSASDAAIQDLFGGHGRVAISGTYAIIGVPLKQDDEVVNAGKAYVYELDTVTNEWMEVKVLLAPDRMTQDAFGVSVAISGKFAIVGANSHDEDANGNNTLAGAGAAYIYERNMSGNWKLKQKITPTVRNEFDRFGTGVAIYGDNAVVGATGNDRDADENFFQSGAGAAYIFTLDDTERWVEVAKIVPSNRASLDAFGFPLAMSAEYIFACSPKKTDEGLNVAGNAYVFNKDTSGIWQESQRFVSNRPSASAEFGNSVCVYGNLAIIGEHKADTSIEGQIVVDDAGIAHIYELDSNNIWSFVQNIEAADRSKNDAFGSSVSISDKYAVVGAIRQDRDENGNVPYGNAGAAYGYAQDGSGYWVQVQKIVASDRVSNAAFGSAVGIDGEVIAIGSQLAPVSGIPLAGALYIMNQCNTEGTMNVTACDAYMTEGGMLLVSSGTYVDTIPNAAGCDSLITIHLVILKSSSATLAVVDCDSFAVPNGDTTFYESGTYVDTIPNAAGCDSAIVYEITIWDAVDTSVIQSGDTLTANILNAQYQWFYCGAISDPIAGATNRVYVATSSGDYSVFIRDTNQCSGFSACINVMTSGLTAVHAFPSDVSVYPNPSSGKFTVDLGDVYGDIQVSVKNLSGQEIQLLQGVSSQAIEVDLTNHANSIYFIEVKSEKFSQTVKVIKQ